MKLVLAISAAVTHDPERVAELVETVAELLRDGHRVAIIHGCGDQNSRLTTSPYCDLVGRNGDSVGRVDGAAAASLADGIGIEARSLSVRLNAARIHSMALCGSDAGICRIRKKIEDRNKSTEIEICAVETRWIEIICANGGVPVVSSSLLTTSGDFYRVDPSYLAARCAISWNADLLTYLIAEDGVIDPCGAVVRWLEAEDIDRLPRNPENKSLIAILKLCKEALRGGVQRARLLPVSRVNCLPLFYVCRIEYGTEVILNFGHDSLKPA